MGLTDDRYISLLTDFGFKRIFGTKPNKDLLITHLFEEAEIARFTKTERREYEDSVKVYRDLKNSLDTALEQGMEKGLEQGRAQGLAEGLEKGRAEGQAKEKTDIARKLIGMGMDIAQIASVTGLAEKDIQVLLE